MGAKSEKSKATAREYGKKWRSENKEHIREYQKKYRSNHLEEHASYERKRMAKPENKAKRNEREKERRKNDPLYAIKVRIKNLINQSLKSKGIKKESKTEQILGCSIKDFHQHIESLFKEGMNWDNRNEWEIDHITPMDSAKTEEEAYKLNHFKNLQPLWANDNRKKSNKIITN